MHTSRNAPGDEDNLNKTERLHSLGMQVNSFAASIERWNGIVAPPTTHTNTGKPRDGRLPLDGGVVPREEGTAAVSGLTKKRFFDNGEGKIDAWSEAETATDIGLPATSAEERETTTSGDKLKGHSKDCFNCESASVPVTYALHASVPHASCVPKACLPLVGVDSPQDNNMLQGSVATEGLRPPQLPEKHAPVTGRDKSKLRKENKSRRRNLLLRQVNQSQWTTFTGTTCLPTDLPPVVEHLNHMCPSRLARIHPAGDLLMEWAQHGCPTMTGRPWTLDEMEAAIARGPHKSAMTPEAMNHFASEVAEKVKAGQARTVLWEDIRHDPPPQLKISPIAAVPHNSKPYRSILDLAFALKLKCGNTIPSVNDATTKLAPQAAVDQLGHSLSRLIHAFGEAGADDKIFMAKWDVKDGFWRLDCAEGEEYNFAYVLPQPAGEPPVLVIPTSLQMGWIESPAYFCTASETGRDVATMYAQTPMGELPRHKFEHYTMGSSEVNDLPLVTRDNSNFRFLVEVFVDDFMSLAIATSQEQLSHVGTSTMMGIHDVFPPCDTKGQDPISEKKMEKGDSEFRTQKTLLGFDFDGDAKTIWLEESKRASLLLILKGWLRTSQRATQGIPFKIFESVLAKIRHAFTTIPAGLGLLSPCNRILAVKPQTVFLQRNKALRTAISDIRTLLKESVAAPTKCKELVGGWPHYIGYTDASGAGFGGIIIGEEAAVTPTVFRGQWPPDIQAELVSWTNRNGSLSINDLELAGLLLTWLVMEEICPTVTEMNVALFSDNQPSVHWVDRMATRKSAVGAQVLRALAFRLKLNRCCPLTPVHVAGKDNSMADVASRSFGTPPQWYCSSDADFANLFNTLFPLPNQNTWTVFRPTREICMRVISILRMQDSSLDEWRRIPRIGQPIGRTGAPMSNLWEWTRISNTRTIPNETVSSPGLQLGVVQAITEEDNKSKLQRSLQLSQPLARRSLWSSSETR